MNLSHEQGGTWLGEPSAGLISAAQWKEIATVAMLTKREQEVCECLIGGCTRSVMADQLDIKPRTVRQHLEQIHKKLNVRNRIGIVLRLIQLRDHIAQRNDEPSPSK